MSFVFPPPTLISSNYNPSFFPSNTNYVLSSDPRMTYLSTTPGTGLPRKSLILDSSSNISGINSFSTTSLAVNGSVVNTSYISGITPGTASASKALVLDSSSNINSLKTTILNVNNGTMQSQATIKGSSSYTSGSAQRLITAQDSTEAVKFDVQATTSAVYLGSYTNHDTWLQSNNQSKMVIKATGNIGMGNRANDAANLLSILDGSDGTTSNFLQVGNGYSINNSCGISWFSYGSGDGRNGIVFNPYGTSNAFVISCNRYIGIGLAQPTCPLHIGIVRNMDVATGGQAWTKMTSSTATITNGSTDQVGIDVSLICSGAVKASSYYAVSDRRLKRQIETLEEDYVDDFYKIDAISYRMDGTVDNHYKQLGYVSQDLQRLGYVELLSYSPNEELSIEEEGDIDKVQIEINYSRISVINAEMIKKLIKKIDSLKNENTDLKNRLNNIEQYNPLKKFLSNKQA